MTCGECDCSPMHVSKMQHASKYGKYQEYQCDIAEIGRRIIHEMVQSPVGSISLSAAQLIPLNQMWNAASAAQTGGVV